MIFTSCFSGNKCRKKPFFFECSAGRPLNLSFLLCFHHLPVYYCCTYKFVEFVLCFLFLFLGSFSLFSMSWRFVFFYWFLLLPLPFHHIASPTLVTLLVWKRAAGVKIVGWPWSVFGQEFLGKSLVGKFWTKTNQHSIGVFLYSHIRPSNTTH